MQRLVNFTFKVLEFAIVMLLAGMVVMVFGNVVLRYGFNSGIAWSEEMSRYFFVWLTFTGAVVTFRENAHLGVETVVRLFGQTGRKVCMLLTNLIILFGAVIFFWGTWLQHDINASMTGALIGIPMIWVFGIGYLTSVGIGLLAIVRIARLLTGKLSDEELAAFAGERPPAEDVGEHAR